MITNFIIIFIILVFAASSNFIKPTWLDYLFRLVGILLLNLFFQHYVVVLSLEEVIIHIIFMFISMALILHVVKKVKYNRKISQLKNEEEVD